MNLNATLNLISLTMVTLVFFAAPVKADEALIAGAKKEGKVVFYTTSTDRDLKWLFGAFRKKYPFINPGAFSANGPEIAEKFLAEERAGRHLADVIAGMNYDMERYKKKNLLTQYRSPSAENFASGMKDPEGYWATDNYTFWVIAYNKTMVKDKDLPRDWFDLLDPKWKGKIAVHVMADRLIAGWEQRLGAEKARQLVDGLKKQNLLLRKGWRSLPQLLAAGEYPLALAFVHHVERLKAKKAPVDWIRSFDPLVGFIRGMGISSSAPNPQAARLFVDFYLSEEGQRVVRNRWGKIPAHPNVDPVYFKIEGLKVYALDSDLMLKNDKHYKEIAKEVFWR